MLALKVGKRRRWKTVSELCVAHVAAVQQRALYGVVREYQPFGQVRAALKQRRYIYNTFSGEAAAARQVHPDLAAGRAVGVHTARTRRHAGKVRALARGELHAHARVYDTTPLRDTPQAGLDPGAVERVRHRANELARRAGQERGVRIQGENVLRTLQGAQIP